MRNKTPLYYCWRDSMRLRDAGIGGNWTIRGVLFSIAFIFLLGMTDGISRWGDGLVRQKKCPPGTLVQSNNSDGSIDCTLKIDRDPAKVTQKWRMPA